MSKIHKQRKQKALLIKTNIKGHGEKYKGKLFLILGEGRRDGKEVKKRKHRPGFYFMNFYCSYMHH